MLLPARQGTYPVEVKYLQTNQRLNVLEVVRQVHQAHNYRDFSRFFTSDRNAIRPDSQ